jgi:AcrR family transcriptional regulator
VERKSNVPEAQPRGGRGARERILWAAAALFYEEGIHATGVERLTDYAHVSKRTFYQHFPSKNALVAEYLAERTSVAEQGLDRADLTARERLLAIFVEPIGDRMVRGCAFHNAAVESAGNLPGVGEVVAEHKRAFTRRLAETAAEAGAADPEELGRRLAVLFEGATALATSLGDGTPVRDAREIAAVLVDAAIP